MEIKLNNLKFTGKKVSGTKLPKIHRGEWRITQITNYLVATGIGRNGYVQTDNGWYIIKLW